MLKPPMPGVSILDTMTAQQQTYYMTALIEYLIAEANFAPLATLETQFDVNLRNETRELAIDLAHVRNDIDARMKAMRSSKPIIAKPSIGTVSDTIVAAIKHTFTMYEITYAMLYRKLDDSDEAIEGHTLQFTQLSSRATASRVLFANKDSCLVKLLDAALAAVGLGGEFQVLVDVNLHEETCNVRVIKDGESI